MSDKEKIVIEEREDGPLVVKNLQRLEMPDSSACQVRPAMALCRCGASSRKPFCDGSHMKTGFSSKRVDVSGRDRIYSYEGKEISVFYNRILCSHAGKCSALLNSVFDPSRKPWIIPENGTVEEIKNVVAACPSGALRFSRPEEHVNAAHIESEDCVIKIEKDGPYHVCNVDMQGVRWAEGASQRKFVLCRCGKSGNKPFCDGAHYDQNWSEEDTAAD